MGKTLSVVLAAVSTVAVTCICRADQWNAYWKGADAGGSFNVLDNWTYDDGTPFEQEKFIHLPESGGIAARNFTVDSAMKILSFYFNAPAGVKTKVTLNAPLEFTQGDDINSSQFISATPETFELDFGTSKVVIQSEYDRKLYMPGTWTMGEGSRLELTSRSAGSPIQFEVVGRLDQTRSEVAWFWDIPQLNGGIRRFIVDEGATWTMDHAWTSFAVDTHGHEWGISPGWGGWLSDNIVNGSLVMTASTNTIASLVNNGVLSMSDQSFLGSTDVTAPVVENTATMTVSGMGNAVWGGSGSGDQISRIDNSGTLTIGSEDAPAELIIHGGSAVLSNAEDSVVHMHPGSSLTLGYSAKHGTAHICVGGDFTQDNSKVVFDWLSVDYNTQGGQLPFRGWDVLKTGCWTLKDASIAFPTSSVKDGTWFFDTNVNRGRLALFGNSRFLFQRIDNFGEIVIADGSTVGYPQLNEHILTNYGQISVTHGFSTFGCAENSTATESKVIFEQRAAVASEGEDPLPAPVLLVGTNDTDEATLAFRAGTGNAYCDIYAGRVDIGRAATLEVSTWRDNQQDAHAKLRNYGGSLRHAGRVRLRPNWIGDIDTSDLNTKSCHVENDGSWLFDGGESGAVFELATCNFGNAVKTFKIISTGAFGGSGLVRTESGYNRYWESAIFTISSSGAFHVDNGGLELRGADLTLESGSTLTFNLGAVPFVHGLSVTRELVTNTDNESESKYLGGTLTLPDGLSADIAVSAADIRQWCGKRRIELINAEGGLTGTIGSVTFNGHAPGEGGVVSIGSVRFAPKLTSSGNSVYLDFTVPIGLTVIVR